MPQEDLLAAMQWGWAEQDIPRLESSDSDLCAPAREVKIL